MMKTRTEFITVRDIYPFSFSCQHHCCWIVNGGLVSRYWRILPMGSLLMRALSHCYSLSCTHLYQKGAPSFQGMYLGPRRTGAGRGARTWCGSRTTACRSSGAPAARCARHMRSTAHACSRCPRSSWTRTWTGASGCNAWCSTRTVLTSACVRWVSSLGCVPAFWCCLWQTDGSCFLCRQPPACMGTDTHPPACVCGRGRARR